MSASQLKRWRLALVWLVLGVLDVIGGAYLRGALLVILGVVCVQAIALMQRRSTVVPDGADILVRNWPFRAVRVARSDVLTVRRGRGVSAILCELLVRGVHRDRRVNVWAFPGEQVGELETLVRADTSTTTAATPTTAP